MKKSTIKDIFNGSRGHIDTMYMPKSDNDNTETVDAAYEELRERLSPEQLNIHKRLVDALESRWLDEVDFYFVEGFKLGLLIGIECAEE